MDTKRMEKHPESPVDTSSRFGYEWNKYSELESVYEEQFRNWIAPFDPQEFRGRDVCDAGCGMGRNSYWALQHQAKSVLAFDAASGSVQSAKRLLARFPHAQVEQMSIYDIAYANRFDICFSIGVIHHLQYPKRAIEKLVTALKPGGRLIVWLYGYEGNEAYLRFFRVIHPLARRMPLGLLHALSYLLSAPLYVLVRLIPSRSWYWKQLRQFKFPHLHSVVFDQLLPEIAHYYKRIEVEELFKGIGLRQVEIHHNQGYSWTVIGTK